MCRSASWCLLSIWAFCECVTKGRARLMRALTQARQESPRESGHRRKDLRDAATGSMPCTILQGLRWAGWLLELLARLGPFQTYIRRLGVLLPGMWCLSFVTQMDGKETLILQQMKQSILEMQRLPLRQNSFRTSRFPWAFVWLLLLDGHLCF
jgi:hypothetical protein